MTRFHVSDKERRFDDENISLFLAEGKDGEIALFAENEQGCRLGPILTIDATGILNRHRCNHIPGLQFNDELQLLTKEEQIAQIESDIREYQELIIANDCEDIGADMIYAMALDRLQRQLKKVKYSRKVK